MIAVFELPNLRIRDEKFLELKSGAVCESDPTLKKGDLRRSFVKRQGIRGKGGKRVEEILSFPKVPSQGHISRPSMTLSCSSSRADNSISPSSSRSSMSFASGWGTLPARSASRSTPVFSARALTFSRVRLTASAINRRSRPIACWRRTRAWSRASVRTSSVPIFVSSQRMEAGCRSSKQSGAPSQPCLGNISRMACNIESWTRNLEG